MDAKFERRFKSFCNSLDALAEARQRDLSDSFVLSGTSAKFSITFDLSWKVMKDILVQYIFQQLYYNVSSQPHNHSHVQVHF